MDYEFIAEPDGSLKAYLEMGHEALGHWINDELGEDLLLGQQVMTMLLQSENQPDQTWTLPGKVYTLTLADGEIEVMANVVHFDFPDELEADMSYYDDEQISGCGVQDFMVLLQNWLSFVREERGMASAPN
ncbi:YacL family protein [Pseudaeromonas sharmana]|uniref:YacL family protein n=1 Tax=Pseudaeromonas sharmana TaxID=328412 RepID=A0ABV8CKI2_9GAMM